MSETFMIQYGVVLYCTRKDVYFLITRCTGGTLILVK